MIASDCVCVCVCVCAHHHVCVCYCMFVYVLLYMCVCDVCVCVRERERRERHFSDYAYLSVHQLNARGSPSAGWEDSVRSHFPTPVCTVNLMSVTLVFCYRVLEGATDMATTLIGTPYYMSPELFSNKPYNHKVSVVCVGGCTCAFVCGCVCVCMHACVHRLLNVLRCQLTY